MDEKDSLRGLEALAQQRREAAAKVAAEEAEAERVEAGRAAERKRWAEELFLALQVEDFPRRAAAAAPIYDALRASSEWERLETSSLGLFGKVPRLKLIFEEQAGVAVEVWGSGTIHRGRRLGAGNCHYEWELGSELVLKRFLWAKFWGTRVEKIGRFASVAALGTNRFPANFGLENLLVAALCEHTMLKLLESGELLTRLIEDARREAGWTRP